MKNLLFIISASLFITCVWPPDPDHGLVENLPAIINKNDVFSFSLRGDVFNYDKTFDLSINVSSNKSLHSTLIVTDFNSNITVTNNDKSNSPKLSKIRLNSFSGIIDFVITAN